MTDHRESPDTAMLVAHILAASAVTQQPMRLSSQQLQLIALYYQNSLKDRPAAQPDAQSGPKKKKAKKKKKQAPSPQSDFGFYDFDVSCRIGIDKDRFYTFNLIDLRNRLAHGLTVDRWALIQDQQEISEDFRIAVLILLARERPDILLRVTNELLHSDSGTELQRSRARLIMIAALREAIKKESSDSPNDEKIRQILGSASESKDNDL